MTQKLDYFQGHDIFRRQISGKLQDRAILLMADCTAMEVVHNLLNSAIFNDFECLLTKILRACRYTTLNFSETVPGEYVVACRPLIERDTWPAKLCQRERTWSTFEVISAILSDNRQSLSRRSNESWHCRWPLVTLEGHFWYRKWFYDFKYYLLVCISKI